MHIIIDIYDLLWDDWNFKAIDSDHLYGEEFVVDSFDYTEEKLRSLLMEEFQIFNLTLYETEFRVHVNITFLKSDNGENTNVSTLVKFLETNMKHDNKDIVETESMKFSYMLYLVDVLEEKDVYKIEQILQDQNINYKKVSQTNNQFEKGLSDVWIDLLIGVAGAASYDAIKRAIKLIEKRFPDRNDIVSYAEFDNEMLLEKVAELGKESKVSLSLRRFNKIEDNKYSVVITSRQYLYEVICNKKGKISEFKKSALEFLRY